MAVELAAPTEVVVGRMIARAAAGRSILQTAGKRAARRGRRRMGIVDASLSNIRRGVSAITAEEGVASPPPTRIVPPGGGQGFGGDSALSPFQPPERIPVPPNAFPTTPVPGSNYFSGSQWTQNVFNSMFQVSPGPMPPAPKEQVFDSKLTNLMKADAATNVLNKARALADKWFPSIAWEGVVNATGFKTTPTRTVVHYALAVCFGLIKQQRVSSVSLVVHVDYENNHVSVAYVSQAYWLTELMTLQVYALSGFVPPDLVKDVGQIDKQIVDNISRSLDKGFREGPTQGIKEFGNGSITLAGDALKLMLKTYQNMGRMLGPLAVYDLGDDTLYGGRASALLRAPFQPEPFKSMQSDKDGKPVPLLTRLPAPNPHAPVAPGTDPACGYSLDLRSLVAQALYDPGAIPPIPDTNVSLPTAA